MIRPRALILLAGLAAATAALAAAPGPAPMNEPKPTAAGKSAPAVTHPPPLPATAAPDSDEKDLPSVLPGAVAPTTPAANPTAPSPVKAVSHLFDKFKVPPPVAKGPAAPPPLSPKYLQVRERIAGLFAARNAPPPPPDPGANPFRPPGAPVAVPVAVSERPIVPVAAASDLTLLQQAAATLTIKGKLERNKSLLLTINYGPGKEGTYKEGDVINVNVGNLPAPLRIRKITRYSVTLALNGAETTLNF